MIYRLEIARIAERYFDRLERATQQRLRAAIEELTEEPRPRGCRKLQGYDDAYRIRVGRYRVIYSVDDQEVIVLIVKLGHRRAVYRKR
ncbi:MAG: type II toxin-antitoxin system RelE/ParE family toxin [Acidobacteria bacterium]|nr:type II toxin-antitoxin system RelE/ParE family toxin [Acidobacteriota bacterium]